MTNLTPERRAELRELLDSIGYDNSEPLRDWMMGHLSGRTHAAMVDGAVNALPALLDAADERDRLAAAVERVRVLHSPGIVFLHAGECGHGDGHTVIEGLDGDPLCFDSPTDERFCVECAGAWDELPAHPCPTLRALDGTDEMEQDSEVDH